MGTRSSARCFVAAALACLLAVAPLDRAVAGAPPPAGPWLRPVDGPLARPFVAPVSRYGAGHRGADLAAPAGTPVRAANAGVVSFAGAVAGSRHVVVAHDGGLRTSYSFLATVAVRRGQRVARGDIVGTAGGGSGEHTGVLHLGLRIGDRYVDPMTLFAPTDLTRLIRLIPVAEPDRAGLDPPALERRALADALHLPQGLPTTEEHASSPLETVGDVLSEAGGVATAAAAPVLGPFARLGPAAAWVWRRSPSGVALADASAMTGRVADWVRSRVECDDTPEVPASEGGSRHLALAVAGVDSHTDPGTGASLGLDPAVLGYRPGEVRWFSYAPDGGPYRADDTTTGVDRAARRLGGQLRAMQREQPGREVDLIGHSLGGVVIGRFLTRFYDAGDPTLPPLGTVVTLSSPWRGSPAATAAAKVGSTGSGRDALAAADRRSGGALPPSDAPVTRQLAEGSRVVRGLVTTSLPEQVEVTGIGAADDVVVPADHAAPAGARAITVNPAGAGDHSAIVRDPAALAATRRALEGRPLPCVRAGDGIRGAVEPVVVSRAEHTLGDAGRRIGQAVDAARDVGGAP